MAYENVPGTWGLGSFKLPDFGLTELISSASGNTSNPIYNNPAVYQAVGGVPSAQNTTTLPWQTLGSNVPNNSSSTLSGSGGGGGRESQLSQLSKMDRNPVQEEEYQRLLSQMQGSAEAQAQAELNAALGELDYQKEGLQAQSGQLDTQRLSALGTIDTETERAKKEATTAKIEATEATRAAQNKALSTAQDIQKKNRNVLRALGILSSSAGGEILTRPMNEYGTQSSELEQGLIKRLATVEDWWMQRSQDFTKAKTDLETQYATLKENIARDLRFNDRQRLSAVKAASAALSQRMAEIQNQAMQYQQAAKQYSDNILLKIAEMKMYQNPTADVSAIYNTLLSTAQGARPITSSQTVTEEQRKRLSGLGQ